MKATLDLSVGKSRGAYSKCISHSVTNNLLCPRSPEYRSGDASLVHAPECVVTGEGSGVVVGQHSLTPIRQTLDGQVGCCGCVPGEEGEDLLHLCAEEALLGYHGGLILLSAVCESLDCSVKEAHLLFMLREPGCLRAQRRSAGPALPSPCWPVCTDRQVNSGRGLGCRVRRELIVVY